MKNIILQGLPGIGKTTLIKKIASKLTDMNLEVSGFYTEELRNSSNQRVGFDIVTLDNTRAVLARKDFQSNYKVGAYSVNLEEFERVALPVFLYAKSILVIDEIGKMESFSGKFQSEVERIVGEKNLKIIATVPLKGGPRLVQKLKQSSSSTLITVKIGNRDKLVDEIISQIVNK